MMKATVRFVWAYHVILTSVDYNGTYEDAVHQATKLLHGEGVSTDGAQDILVEEWE